MYKRQDQRRDNFGNLSVTLVYRSITRLPIVLHLRQIWRCKNVQNVRSIQTYVEYAQYKTRYVGTISSGWNNFFVGVMNSQK